MGEINHSSKSPDRRWWQYARAWLIGVPVVILLGIAGLFAWGSLQPKPEGFAVAESAPQAPKTTEAMGTVSTTVEERPELEVQQRTLDATSTENWVLFDFLAGQVTEDDLTTTEWDVAFRRTKLLTNSGVTNPAGPGGAIDLGEVALEEAVAPGTEPFVVDRSGGEDGDEPENAAAGKWYSYSFITHVVSTKPNTYIFRTGEEFNAMVQFDSYYCEDGEAGCITFRYRLVPQTDKSS